MAELEKIPVKIETVTPGEQFRIGFRYTTDQLPGSALINTSSVTAVRVRRSEDGCFDDTDITSTFLNDSAATVSADGLEATVLFLKNVASDGDDILLTFTHVLDDAASSEFQDFLLLRVRSAKTVG